MTQVVTLYDALDIATSTVEVVHKHTTKRQVREQSQKVLKSLHRNTIIYNDECAHIEIQVEASTAAELCLRVTINHSDELVVTTKFSELDPIKSQGLGLLTLFAEILTKAPSLDDAVHLAWHCRMFLMAADYAHRFPKYAVPYDEAPFEYEQAAAA